MQLRRRDTLWAVLMIAWSVVITTASASPQNLESILGINESSHESAVVLRQSVDTTNTDELVREIDRLLGEIDHLLDDITRILENKGSLPGSPGSRPPATTTTSSPANSSSRPPTGTGRSFTYTVVPGDSLWKIAQRFLGRGSRYWELVEANKGRYPSLAKNPNLIYPGWKLTIPGVSGAPPSPPPGSPPPSSSSGESAALNNWKGGKLPPSEFCRLLGPVARESMRVTGVPASVTLAQAALETGWGAATIGDAKNLFGIKGTGPAGSITVPTREYINGRYVTVQGTFRKYHTWRESIDDHARLLTTAPRYRNCMANKHDPDQFARELQKAGYATSPTYASTLISIMRQYNLYQYDR
ncbi:MAG: N-acetylmuramoyl-L-alanine amidase-like protein [Candidatus Ozemobacter sibiricus]|jgi:LysM repeat protein|uniref:Peptidoglycan hydrolase n=1 Tax=Candidatus Ozemobacter sibiricus TaxID=2268124 RepID=A0A367ZW77_9BACT|nr:MAG: N-acetylmuramoyl-L-alanine amidase-like protein [Candidatus Ozemobacter sibiricus]